MKLLRLDSNARNKRIVKKISEKSGIGKRKNCRVKERVKEDPPSLEEIYEKYEKVWKKEKPQKKDKFK